MLSIIVFLKYLSCFCFVLAVLPYVRIYLNYLIFSVGGTTCKLHGCCVEDWLVDWDYYEASYYTCKDERICFRAGWLQFASQQKLGDGPIVLILFHKDNADRLFVSFDRL